MACYETIVNDSFANMCAWLFTWVYLLRVPKRPGSTSHMFLYYYIISLQLPIIVSVVLHLTQTARKSGTCTDVTNSALALGAGIPRGNLGPPVPWSTLWPLPPAAPCLWDLMIEVNIHTILNYNNILLLSFWPKSSKKKNCKIIVNKTKIIDGMNQWRVTKQATKGWTIKALSVNITNKQNTKAVHMILASNCLTS